MHVTDSKTFASNPGGLILSKGKVNQIKDVYKLGFFKRRRLDKKKTIIQKFIKNGDTEPAIVVSVEPLKIASYSEE